MKQPLPLKSLGQNFLVQKRFGQKIADAVGKRKVILEIGAGRGDLTVFLISQAERLLAVEVDRRLCAFLKERFKNNPNFELYCQDILKFKWQKARGKATVVGNVPYYLSNDLVYYLVSQRRFIKEAFLTFQYEFGQKLLAKGRQKSFLSFYLQYYAKVTPLFVLPPKAFFPPPQVKSLFLKLDFAQPFKKGFVYEECLFKIMRRGFSQRRKKLSNSLKAFYQPEKIKAAFEDLGLDSSLRPEELSLADFLNLAKNLCRC